MNSTIANIIAGLSASAHHISCSDSFGIVLIKLYKGNPEGEGALLQSILTLAVVFFGLHTMARGFFPSSGKRKHRDNSGKLIASNIAINKTQKI